MLLKKDIWLSKQIGFNAYDLKKPLNLDFSDLEKKLIGRTLKKNIRKGENFTFKNLK